MSKKIHPPIKMEILEKICKIIAHTENGLTGSEIGHILNNSYITDTDPTFTKWKRLFNAFANYQNKKECSNNILLFIHKAISTNKTE